MVGRCHGISCLFVFRTNGKKVHLDENNVCHNYGNFLKRKVLKVRYLIAARFKVFSRQLEDIFRGGSRAAATIQDGLLCDNSYFVIIVIKHSILDVAAALDPPLMLITAFERHFTVEDFKKMDQHRW